MGLFFKKSKKLGLFRLNASKSGLGLSFGIKGCRISANSKGLQLNTGAKGTYYRKSISWNKLKNNDSNTQQENNNADSNLIQIEISKEQQNFNDTFRTALIISLILGLVLVLIHLWFFACFVVFLGFLFNLKISLSKPNLFREMIDNSRKFSEYRKQGYYVEYKQIEDEQKRLEKKYKKYNYSYENYKK